MVSEHVRRADGELGVAVRDAESVLVAAAKVVDPQHLGGATGVDAPASNEDSC